MRASKALAHSGGSEWNIVETGQQAEQNIYWLPERSLRLIRVVRPQLRPSEPHVRWETTSERMTTSTSEQVATLALKRDVSTTSRVHLNHFWSAARKTSGSEQ